MRTLLPAIFLIIATAMQLSSATIKPPVPPKPPAGKCLTAICTLQPGLDSPCQSVTKPPAKPAAATPAITLKLDCVPSGHCTPIHPVHMGEQFLVTATPWNAVLSINSGKAEQVGGNGSYLITPTAAGKLVLEAKQPLDSTVQPVRLSLDVVDPKADPQSEAALCARLLPPSTTIPKAAPPTLEASTLVGLLGDPKPFSLVAEGKGTILIYSTVTPAPAQALEDIESSIKTLLAKSAADFGVTPSDPFTVEISIPHAGALGTDLATKLSSVNYKQFKIENVGTDRVRITATSQPECKVWSAFLGDIRHIAWQLIAEPPDMKLFYLNAPDVSTAFGSQAGSGGGGAGAGGGAGGGAGAGAGAGAGGGAGSGGGAGTSGSGAGSGGGAASGTGNAAGGASGSGASGGAASGGAAAQTSNATISITQPPGSTIDLQSATSDCSASGTSACTGSGAGSSATGAGSSGGPSSAAGASPAPTPPPAPKPTTMVGIGQDLLLFSDATPGDDAAIVEQKRILAMLDLPRPEMIINAWVMQNSTTDREAMGGFNNIVHRVVTNNNDALQVAILRGWNVVKESISNPERLDKFFFRYVSDRYIAEPVDRPLPKTPDEGAQEAVDMTQPTSPLDNVARKRLGICEANRYCLGYANLFQPLKPRLTDLLLAVTASNHPVELAESAIREMEQPIDTFAVDRGLQEKIRHSLDLQHADPGNCEVSDLNRMLEVAAGRPALQLECFRSTARLLLDNSSSPSAVGLLRAAIANFLFNYKLSQQYPHQFAPYELSQSADALNSALSPLIEAFNRDLTAYQTYLRADLAVEVNDFNSEHDHRFFKKMFGADKPSFFNDGLVTVRTISGKYTTVDTTSQSFLDASTAPQLSDLVSAITGTTPPGGTSNLGGKLSPNILNNLSFNEAQVLMGALKAYQSTKAQIGRGLTVDATPRSLNGASSAEIDVTLNADESAAPTYYGGSQAGSAMDLSRVAKHDTSTRVRVESIKLFEVSSFSAILQRSRPRFPLIPPFVELPYIGTIAGIPLPAAKEYHSSTAILSAIVVPTAADLAYGLTFQNDHVVDASGACQWAAPSAGTPAKPFCRLRRALSLSDIDKQPIRSFHKAVIHCLATDMIAPNSSLGGIPAANACDQLDFGEVFHDGN